MIKQLEFTKNFLGYVDVYCVKQTSRMPDYYKLGTLKGRKFCPDTCAELTVNEMEEITKYMQGKKVKQTNPYKWRVT